MIRYRTSVCSGLNSPGKMFRLAIFSILTALLLFSFVQCREEISLIEKDTRENGPDKDFIAEGDNYEEQDDDLYNNADDEMLAEDEDSMSSSGPLSIVANVVDPSFNPRRRSKRTSYKQPGDLWPHHIPYVITKKLRNATRTCFLLRLTIETIEENLCVKYTDETDRFDPKNSRWLTELGYKFNTHLKLKDQGCLSSIGFDSNEDFRSSSPCVPNQMHELLHSLGMWHTSKMPFPTRKKYFTWHPDNLRGMTGQYSPTSFKMVNSEYFDPTSIMNYGPYWSIKKGLTSYDYVRSEMFRLNGGTLSLKQRTFFYELNKNYKCAETYCSGNKTKDCGEGYLTYVRNECVCVCPDYYDPDSNCTKLLNQDQDHASWPDIPFTVFKVGEECPDGFKSEDKISITGKYAPQQTGLPFPTYDKTLQLELCVKDTPENVNWTKGLKNAYCVGKLDGVPCVTPWLVRKIQVTAKGPVSIQGSVGDVKMDGTELRMRFCCFEWGHSDYLNLPNTKSFALRQQHDSCRDVKGMRTYLNKIGFEKFTSKKKKDRKIDFEICSYMAPVYGCNELFKLSADQRRVNFSLPKTGSHLADNRRCFYAFQAPKNSRLRLTYNTFDIHRKDFFLLKRFQPWTTAFRVHRRFVPRQTITEINYLFIEFWSFYTDHQNYTGADLTVDLLLDEELCYSPETHGRDYAGDKAVTEEYEECVHWKDATHCTDFPRKQVNELMKSGNKCRNPDGVVMFQPWCYAYVNHTECVRRYCDVCNGADPVDKISDCAERLKTDPNLCTDRIKKLNCFKTCGLPTDPYDGSKVRCARPELPSEVVAMETLRDSYQVGDNVKVTCKDVNVFINCTTLGWTPFPVNCSKNLCIDESQLCQNALSKTPDLCSRKGRKWRTFKPQCRKSCGECDPATCKVSNGTTYSLVYPESGELKTGEAATFVCDFGLIPVSGDLSRACSVSGSLLGEEPVCKAVNSYPVDLNTKLLRRLSSSESNYKYRLQLLTSPDARIPYDGKITRWYYFCKREFEMYMVVFRNVTDKESTFQRIGIQKVPCFTDRLWNYEVSPESQIAVKEGDLIGVYQPRSTLTWRSCSGKPDGKVRVKKWKKTPKAMFKKDTLRIKTKDCVYISMGARVEPSSGQ